MRQLAGSDHGRKLTIVADEHKAARAKRQPERERFGELSGFINVYVNDRDVRYRDGLATAVGPDDTIILLPAMAGGARQA